MVKGKEDHAHGNAVSDWSAKGNLTLKILVRNYQPDYHFQNWVRKGKVINFASNTTMVCASKRETSSNLKELLVKFRVTPKAVQRATAHLYCFVVNLA